MSALQSSLKGFLSEENANTDLSNASDETLVTAKEKLYKLMEKMKEISTQGISSPITMQELKDKITAQINKIRLIEKYLLTQKKSKNMQSNNEINYRENGDNNIENLESNAQYTPLYDPDEFDNIDSTAIDAEENDNYQIMNRRSNSWTSMIKSFGNTVSNTTWNVWNRVKIHFYRSRQIYNNLNKLIQALDIKFVIGIIVKVRGKKILIRQCIH